MPNAAIIRIDLVGNTAQAEAAFKKAGSTIRDSFQSVAGSIGGVYAAFQTISSAVSQLVEVQLAAQKIESTLKVATGSSAAAAAEMAFVREEASRLGLELYSTADQYAKLAVAARGTALQGEGARKLFVAVAEASTVLGMSAEDTGGALNAMQQMISKGKVSAEELRGQLGERLPGALKLAANGMGMTTAQLDKAMASGKIMASDLLPRLADQLHKVYGPDAQKAASGLQGQINGLKTSWQGFLQTVWGGGGGGLVGTAIDLIRGGIEVATWTWKRFHEAFVRISYGILGLGQQIKYALILVWEEIKAAGLNSIGGIVDGFAWLLDKIAGGLRSIGADEVADSISRSTAGLRGYTAGLESMSTVAKRVNAEFRERVSILEDMQREDIAKIWGGAASAAPPPPPPSPGPLPGGEIDPKTLGVMNDLYVEAARSEYEKIVRKSKILMIEKGISQELANQYVSAEQKKLVEKAEADVLKIMLDKEKEAGKERVRLADERANIERKIAEETGPAALSPVAAIRLQADAWRLLGVDRVAIERWTTAEMGKLQTQALEIAAESERKANEESLRAWEEKLSLAERIRDTEREQAGFLFNSRMSRAGDALSAIGGSDLGQSVAGLAAFNEGQDPYTQDYQRWEQLQDQKIQAMEAYGASEQALRDAYREYDVQREQMTTERKIAMAGAAFGTMGNIAEAFYNASGKKGGAAFEAMKAFRIAETIINTRSAAIGAYNAMSSIPFVGPALGVAAAAAAIATGMMQVKAIASQKPGGSASGMSIGGGAPSIPALPFAAAPNTPREQESQRRLILNVHVYGNIVGHDEFAREMVPYLEKAVADGVRG